MIPWFETPALPIGPIVLHSYGLLLVGAWAFGAAVAMARIAWTRGRSAVTTQLGVATAVLVCGIPAAHLAYVVFYRPDRLQGDLGLLLQLYEGMAVVGLVMVLIPLAATIFCLRDRAGRWRQADASATGLVAGWIPARFACFLAHDHPGPPTSFVLGVRGICLTGDRDQACHDLGLYEMLLAVAVLTLLGFLARSRPGTTTLAAGVFASLGRFLLDFWRPEASDLRWCGLTAAQWVAAAIAAGCVLLWVRWRKAAVNGSG